MSFIKTKIRFQEAFKDGLLARDFGLQKVEYFPGQTLVCDEVLLRRIEASGGVFDVLEQVIPNPVKSAEVVTEAKAAVEVAPKKKAGRPKKAANAK